MKNNIGKKAYCFEKLTGGVNLDGTPCVDGITLTLRICDVIDYNSDVKQYVVRTQFLNKNIDCNSAFFNKEELKGFFESFFLENNILDFNNGEICYLCDEINRAEYPVKELNLLLTKRKVSRVGDYVRNNKPHYAYFNVNDIQNELLGLLRNGILDELTF